MGSALEYRNPLNNIFFNVRYNFNQTDKNILFSYTQDPSNQQNIVEGLNIDNTAKTNSVRTELGKYFPKFKTNASVSYNYSINNFQQLTNNVLNNVESQNQGYSVKFNNNYFSWLSVDYNASWAKSLNKTFNNKINSFNHTLSTYIYPIKDHTIGFTWDELTTKNVSASRTNSFYDISYQYSLAKEKMDIELKVVNIANTNLYQDVSFNAQFNQTTIRNMNIRPRQVLLTVKFNFK